MSRDERAALVGGQVEPLRGDATAAELEILAIYLVVITVLIARPAGLFGRPVE